MAMTEKEIEQQMKEIEQQIIAIVAEALGIDVATIHPKSTFVGDLEADSLDIVELMMTIEAKFNINIPDEVAVRITTVEDAVKYVQAHIPA